MIAPHFTFSLSCKMRSQDSNDARQEFKTNESK
jgi:hypothetical protein